MNILLFFHILDICGVCVGACVCALIHMCSWKPEVDIVSFSIVHQLIFWDSVSHWNLVIIHLTKVVAKDVIQGSYTPLFVFQLLYRSSTTTTTVCISKTYYLLFFISWFMYFILYAPEILLQLLFFMFLCLAFIRLKMWFMCHHYRFIFNLTAVTFTIQSVLLKNIFVFCIILLFS